MAKHRLVAIGDSLTMGFINGAAFRTEWSFPAIVARAMGGPEPFRSPLFAGPGGIPLNLEWIVRSLGERFGSRIGLLELPAAIVFVHRLVNRIEQYWERGPGARPLEDPEFHHNLAVWGYEIADALEVTSNYCDAAIPTPRKNWFGVPERPLYRSARRVLNPTANPAWGAQSALGVTQRLAEEDGVENLIVFLGANHALGAMTRLDIRPSTDADLDVAPHLRTANLYKPEHFRTLFERLLAEIDRVGAERVYLGTVPHVTIPPVARGVGGYGDGYYAYYTRPWIWDSDFDPSRHTALTAEQARTIDRHVDAYNEIIVNAVAQRGDRFLIPIGSLLDQLAFRRRKGEVGFRFPSGLVDVLRGHPRLNYLVDDDEVRLDTRYMRTRTVDGETRLTQGGLFSLDGMHPTITGAGIIAEGVLRRLRDSGVETEHDDVSWDAIVEADTLVNEPPPLLDDLQSLLRFLDRRGLLSRLLALF